ncbi:hypothetical protein HGA91_05440 [candidate division WWE3 bacterium]|nr:hypothetical protein [candidate division WWE3 bacterium]
MTDITDLVFKLVLIGTCIGSAWIGYDPTPQKHDSGWRAARLFGGINALLASVILGKLLFGVAFGYAHQQQVQSLMFFVQYAAHGVWYALNMWAYWRIMKKVS